MKYCINCGFQLEDDYQICPRCATNQAAAVKRPKRSFWLSVPGIIIIFLVIAVLVVAGIAYVWLGNNSTPVMATRPATEIILSPGALGSGWSGEAIGTDTYAIIELANKGQTFDVSLNKYSSFDEARIAYDIAAISNSSIKDLNLGEQGKLTMSASHFFINFYRGNVVVTISWTLFTNTLSEAQMEHFAKIQNDRIG
jgi:predicted nucleic acid-binding Zn ribbon protein